MSQREGFNQEQTRIRREREDRERLSAARRAQQLREDSARRHWEQEEFARRRAANQTRSSPTLRSFFEFVKQNNKREKP